MTVFSGTTRQAVVARALDRCEYCHLPTTGQVATFPIDHLVPRDQGGQTHLDNLAMACPRCNGHKWKHQGGTDPESGEAVRLFNPRIDSWAEHFSWSPEEVGLLQGRTAIGRATIERLQMNHPHHQTIRKLLSSLGLFAEVMVTNEP